jgi:hypothetical protein
MKKVMEGIVSYDRCGDTGNPYEDFRYEIGYNGVPNLEDELYRYKGKKVRLTVMIEELPYDEESDNDQKEDDE